MKARFAALVCVGILSACSAPENPQERAAAASEATAAPKAASAAGSGIEQPVDAATRPQDDFYRYVNGKWLEATEIPSDKPAYGVFSKLADDAQANLRAIIEEAAKAGPAASDVDQRKIGDFYASFLDEATIDAAAAKPIEETFARIDAAKNGTDIAVLMAELGRSLTQPGPFGPAPTLPLNIIVHQDNKDATKYIADLQQSGLGLPDRDYYIKDDDAKLKDIRAQYGVFLEKIFSMAGNKHAAHT